MLTQKPEGVEVVTASFSSETIKFCGVKTAGGLTSFNILLAPDVAAFPCTGGAFFATAAPSSTNVPYPKMSDPKQRMKILMKRVT